MNVNLKLQSFKWKYLKDIPPGELITVNRLKEKGCNPKSAREYLQLLVNEGKLIGTFVHYRYPAYYIPKREKFE
jgi:hypothetical protein